MTAITQTQAVLEGLANKTVSNAKALSIVKNYLQYDDAEGLTNEQIAQRFIDRMRKRTIHDIRAGATRKAQLANAVAVQAASDNAIINL